MVLYTFLSSPTDHHSILNKPSINKSSISPSQSHPTTPHDLSFFPIFLTTTSHKPYLPIPSPKPHQTIQQIKTALQNSKPPIPKTAERNMRRSQHPIPNRLHTYSTYNPIPTHVHLSLHTQSHSRNKCKAHPAHLLPHDSKTHEPRLNQTSASVAKFPFRENGRTCWA